MCRKSRFGRASGVILGVLALFFGTFRFRRAYRMHSELHFGTFQTPKTVLPSGREHRFQKITVSANYLDLALKITSQTDLQDASMALKTRPKRSQTHLESLFGRLRGSLRTLLGAPRPLWSDQGPPESDPGAPCGSSRAILDRLFDPMHLWETSHFMNVTRM